jgi:chromosomal replication initiator protein
MMHGTVTPTQRAAIERQQQFRASIAAKAAELADRKTRLKLAAIPIAAIEAPLVSVPSVAVVSQDDLVEKASEPCWFVVLPPGHGHPQVRDIQKAVCKHYDVTLSDMLSPRRTANIVKPRQVAMFLCKELTLRTLPELGRRFGGRDHTTVLHAIRKIPRDMRADADLAGDIAILRKAFTGSAL